MLHAGDTAEPGDDGLAVGRARPDAGGQPCGGQQDRRGVDDAEADRDRLDDRAVRLVAHGFGGPCTSRLNGAASGRRITLVFAPTTLPSVSIERRSEYR